MKRLLFLVPVVILVACTPPGGGDNNTNTINIFQGTTPSPNPSSSPFTGAPLPAGYYMIMRIFGQDGPNCPNGQTLKVGCLAHVTATPKRPDGTDVPSTEHGPDITWEYVSGNGTVADCIADPASAFNRLCQVKAPGTLILKATVKNLVKQQEFLATN